MTTLPNVVPVYYYPRAANADFERLLSVNGAVLDGVTDDTSAIQAALNTFTNSARGHALFPPGLSAVISNPGLTITSGYCGIDFNALNLIYSCSAGYAMTVLGNPNSPFSDWANLSPIENFRLLGPVPGTFTSTAMAPVSATSLTDTLQSWVPGIYAGVSITNVASGQTVTITGNTPTTLTFSTMSPALTMGQSYRVSGNNSTSTLSNGDGLFTGDLATPGSVGSVNQILRNFQIKGFRNGWTMGNQYYVNGYYWANIQTCWQYGIYAPCANNAGENISIHGGNIANNCSVNKVAAGGSAVGIYIPANANSSLELNLFGVSLDYNDKAFLVNSGSLNQISGHLEDSHYLNTLGDVVYGGSGVNLGARITGGVVAATESQANARPYYFLVTGPRSYFNAKTSFSTYNRSSTIVSSSGTVQVSVSRDSVIELGGPSATAWPAVGLANNLLGNPGFEMGIVSPWIVPTGSTATIVSSGTHGGSAYAAQVVVTSGTVFLAQRGFPVRTGEKLIAQGWVNLTARTAGTLFLQVQFYYTDPTINPVPGGTLLSSVPSTTSLSSAPSGYANLVLETSTPPGATFAVFGIYGTSFVGTFIVDDCELAVF